MKHKIIALLLSLVFCVGLFGTAFAVTSDQLAEGTTVFIRDENGATVGSATVGANGSVNHGYGNNVTMYTVVNGNQVPVTRPGGGGGGDGDGDDDFIFVGGSNRPNVAGYGVIVAPTSHGSVNVSPIGAAQGTTVTIVATPDAGYAVGSVTVTDANGNKIQVTDLGDGRYTFVMPAVGVTVDVKFVAVEKPADQQPQQPGTSAVTYSDVDPEAWYANAVSYVTLRGIMNGTGDGKFSPNATTTRGMVMTMLARMNGVNTEGGANWYEKGMQWAKAQGISDGTNPNGVITREQLVTMLYRYMSSPASAEDIGRYPDASAVSDWAANAMKWGVEVGLITGTGDGALNPGGTASRAEVATIMMRFCQTFGI